MTTPVVTPGKGTTLKVSVSGTPTLIGQIQSITPFTATGEAVETTDLDQTWKSYIGSILDGGTLTFVLNWDADNSMHGTVWTKFTGQAVESFTVTFVNAGASTAAFSGVITGFNIGAAQTNNIVQATITVKVTGAITVTA